MLYIPGLLLLLLVAVITSQQHISIKKKNGIKDREDDDDTMSAEELCSVLSPHPGGSVLEEAKRTGHLVFPEQGGEKCHVNEDLWVRWWCYWK